MTQLPFSATTTALEVVEGVDLTGRRALVTGGASGIGVETVRALATAGAEVTIAVRNPAAGAKVVAELGLDVAVARLDLADPVSVRALVQTWDGPLHVLVHNAGIMATPETYDLYGRELQFATNHLGHLALATGLHGALAAEGARVVSVSSRAHLRSDVHLDDLSFDRRPYDPWLAYGQSKTANVLFAVEAARRWAADGITVNALHPGGIQTALTRHLDPAERDGMLAAISLKTVEQGAATSVLLAASPLVEGVTGRYFEDCQEAGPTTPGTRTGYAPYAMDPDHAADLWEVSARLIEDTSA